MIFFAKIQFVLNNTSAFNCGLMFYYFTWTIAFKLHKFVYHRSLFKALGNFHLVRSRSPSHAHWLRWAAAPQPWVCTRNPEMWHVRSHSDWLSELQYGTDGNMYSLCHQEQRCSWDLQWGQTHRLYHVHHLYHLVGLRSYIFWHIAIHGKGKSLIRHIGGFWAMVTIMKRLQKLQFFFFFWTIWTFLSVPIFPIDDFIGRTQSFNFE